MAEKGRNSMLRNKRKRIKELEICKKNRKRIKSIEELSDIIKANECSELKYIKDSTIVLCDNKTNEFFEMFKEPDSDYVVIQYVKSNYNSYDNAVRIELSAVDINDLSDNKVSPIADLLISGNLYLTNKLDMLEIKRERNRKLRLVIVDMYDVKEYFDNMLERVKEYIKYSKTLLLEKAK